MKGRLFVVSLLLIFLIGVPSVFASENATIPVPGEIVLQFEELKGDHLVLDLKHGIWLSRGREITKVSGYEVPFVVCEESEHLVPFRLLAELMGWTVFWDQNKNTVYAQVIEFSDMGNSMLAGRFIEFDYPSSQRFRRVIVEDRVMVPLSLISDFLRWNHGYFETIFIANERLVIKISTLG